MNFARFFGAPIFYMIIYVSSSENSRKIHGRIHVQAASGVSENRPCLTPAANFLIFPRTGCKSVFKVLSLSILM